MLRLQYERLIRGWSQAKLARLAGLHQPVVCLIELRRLRPNEDELHRLARALGVPPVPDLLEPVRLEPLVEQDHPALQEA